MRRHLGGIEIEIRYARETTRLLPLVIFVAGRHKGEPSLEISQRGSGQTLDEGLAVATHALLVDDKQVTTRAEAKFDPFTCRGLHDFGRHAVPSHAASLDDVIGKNLHDGIHAGGGELITETGRLVVSAIIPSGTRVGTPVHRRQHRRSRCPQDIPVEKRGNVRTR